MKFTREQIEAINHKDGPALVLAVPGSGKTTVLLQRIKELSKSIDQEKILSITFSRSQADDMKNRFEKDNRNFMTVHAFCYLIIKNKLRKENKNLRLLESLDKYNKYDLVYDIYKEINNKKISKEDLNTFFTATGYMKNAMLDESYLNEISFKNLRLIYQKYEEIKKEIHAFDFDDMQVLAYKYINEDQRLLKSIKNRYKYFQLDEGQDTSLLQFKILEKIVYPENNIFIVADDDQSIYSFRAANPKYLLQFKDNYENSKIIFLSDNFRSQKNVVKFAGAFINQNKNRYNKSFNPTTEISKPIKAKSVKNFLKEYEYIIKNFEDKKTNAIIYRNNVSSINIMNYLYEKNIKFNMINSNLDFFDSNILKDILDIIEFSENRDNIELFERIYYKINAYIKKEWIESLKYKPKNMDIFDYLIEKIGLDEFYENTLIKKSKELDHIKKLPLNKKISFIYKYLGYKNYLYKESHKNRNMIINKDIYFESLEYFVKEVDNIEDFYKKIETFKKLSQTRNNSNIFISTIHGVKGLEFDNVFVIDLVENEFPIPINNDKEGQETLEEERRIFYVAITRAKENLHLLSLKTRNNTKCNSSIFYDFATKK
ncbi:MAG: ATP-dependent helicase [Tissierellia bacterium]|nr:ATP-dependent helicase [Tissierellia bacterium]